MLMVGILKPALTSALIIFVGIAHVIESQAAGLTGPEETIRTLVRANAEKDLTTLSRLMAHDPDITSYTIGGRKYVGWPDHGPSGGKESSDPFRHLHERV